MNYPQYIDGEVILGSHCFCGYVGFPNGDRILDLERYREHLKYCSEYKKWIDGIFPPIYLASLPYGAIIGNNYMKHQPKNKKCVHCDFDIYAILVHNTTTYHICVRCKKPFNVEDSQAYQNFLRLVKADTNGSSK